ncbi:FG-GAP-like repeat-containing protein [Fulvivirga lutea]|uniref:VCBS repeat-containing protein n=1 Tax=Fulvivirga lutea TaxID=2810512 RepID=A0A974WEQ7_9BACT|nr:FG-GAP-like repeat-containing protein [Fulvivirga lutea]QSE96781.1 VCBS repeat-containing protein [Fulvivirga lutea]
MRNTFLLFFIITSTIAIAQPTVSNIDPETTYPGGEVVISGSGFGTNAADVRVWFGGVLAQNIVSVSNTSIVVEAPAAAPNAPVSVSRTSTGLSGVSRQLFYISYSGASFDVNDLEPEIALLNNGTENFDICGCDFDGDGKVDLASTQRNGTFVNILRNNSNVGAISFELSTIDISTPATSIGCTDLDGDGKQDLYMSREGSNTNQLYLFRNLSTIGNISFGGRIIVNLLTNDPTGSPYQAVKVEHGDLNGDGKPDLVVTNGNAEQRLINIVENNSTVGNISFETALIFELDIQDTSGGISIQDLDNDGLLDLAMTRNQASNFFVYRNLGGGGFNFGSPIELTTGGETIINVTAADLNGDGFKELIVTETLKSNVLIYENTSSPGTISYANAAAFTVGTGAKPNSGPWVARGADMNGDGLLDLVVADRGEESYSVLLNQGSLNFTAINNTTPYANRNMYTGDLDGDAKPDLAFTALEIPSGNFSLQIIRNSNCFQPTILNEQPLAICAGQTLTLETQNSPGTTYSWTLNSGDLGLSTSSIDITTFGTYEVTAVSEGGSCTNTASINVSDGSGTIPTDPVATNDGPACTGSTVTLSVDNQAGATYSWVGPNGFTSTDQNPVISNLTLEDAGLYEVTVKVGDCLSSSVTTEVLINTAPSFSLSASGATTVCQGSAVSLSTQNRAGFTYQWLRDGADAGGSSPTFSANTSGVYQVRITENSTSCEVFTNEVNVLVLSAPVASFDFNTPICTGIDATFTNTSTVDPNATVVYSWDFGDGSPVNTTDAIRIFTTSGSYDITLSIQYTGVTGCTSNTTNTINVVDAVPVNITAPDNTICEGETIDLTADGTFSSITWGNGETTEVISVSTAGTYSVVALDNNDCESTDQITIVQGEVPAVLAFANDTQGSITISRGTEVQLLATEADSYSWSPTDFLSDPSVANPISTPTSNITYTVMGAITGGCIGTATVEIIVGQSAEEIDVEHIAAFNPDNSNDPTWRIERSENYPECTISVFDERGSLVFRKLGYNNDWDGTYEGTPLPEGVYYFVFSCPAVKPYTGTVMLVR